MYKKLCNFKQTTLMSTAIAFLLGCSNNSSSLETKNQKSQDPTKLVIQIDGNTIEKQGNLSVKTTPESKPTSDGTNIAPTAIATANDQIDYLQVHAGDEVFFDGTQSYDEDGKIIHYVWTDIDNNIVTNKKSFTETFDKAAIYEKTLTVFDDKGATSQARVCVAVDIEEQDIPLMANAGSDMIVPEGYSVVLNGHAVCKNGNYSYEWSENNEVIAKGATVTKVFTPGEHHILLTVTDTETGLEAYDTVNITVNPVSKN